MDLSPEVSLDLNTETSVALKSDHIHPTIELVSGEVIVNAASPPQGPLMLLAAGGQLTAREAKFDAKCLRESVAAVNNHPVVRAVGEAKLWLPKDRPS